MSGDGERAAGQGRWWAGVAGLGLLALVLRLWGMGGESAWWDEYSSLVHLQRGTLWDFLRYNRTLDPATLPLYYTLEYFWSRLVGMDTYVMRLPSVVMGLALLPVMYGLGRRCFGEYAGWVAAMCVAVSPIHIFHAQGIRMYVLFTLLAAVSMYTWLALREERKARWWWGHGVAQLLLSWTHPFAILIPVAQGAAWLLGLRREGVKAYAGWCALTLAAWLPVLAYLATVRYWPEDSTAGWFPAPTFFGVVTDLFADDVIAATYQLRVSPDAWAWLPVLGPMIASARPLLDGALGLVLLGVIAVCVALWVRTRRSGDARWGLVPALLVWFVLPVLALYVGSLLFRPMMFPRYTVHCSLALYLLAGGALSVIPGRGERVAAAVALGLLLLYQTTLMHPGPQRADYAGVAAAIAAEAKATDVVVVRGELWRDVFAYNAGGLTLPIIGAEDDALSALAARLYLDGAAPGAVVWLAVPDDYFDDQPETKLAAALSELKLAQESRRFFGIHDFELLRVTAAGAGALPKRAKLDATSEESRRLLRTVSGVAAGLAQAGRGDAAGALLRVYLGETPERDALYGSVARAVREEGATAYAAWECALELSDTLALQERGERTMVTQELLRLAALPECPPLVSTLLMETAGEAQGSVREMLDAAFAVRNRPVNLHFNVLEYGVARPEMTAVFLEAALAAPGIPPDFAFHLVKAAVSHPEQGLLLLGALPKLEVLPEDLYYHLTTAAREVAAKQGCGELLGALLAQAKGRSPLDYALNWSPLERRCATGGEVKPFLDAKAQSEQGMAAFGEGKLEVAAAAFEAGRLEGFGLPSLMLGILALDAGDRGRFVAGVEEALKDPGLAEVFGPTFRAILAGDRAGAVAAAEALRGTDINSTDTLLGVIERAMPGGVSSDQ